MQAHPGQGVFIRATPDAVFEYVADLSRHKEWAADTVNAMPHEEGPVAVGKRYHSDNHFQLGDVHDELEVTIYEPPRRFGFIARGPKADVDHLFVLTPTNDGTDVQRVITVLRAPLMLRLFLPVADLLFGKASNTKSLAQLKAKLEMPGS